MLLVGVGIAAAYVWQFADAAYGLVIVWAYAGIAVKEAATQLVPQVAVAGAVIVLALTALTLLGRRRAPARAIAGVRPTPA